MCLGSQTLNAYDDDDDEQRATNFPIKIKNSLFPVNIFHLTLKNPGLTFSARRRCVEKFTVNADLFCSERIIRRIINS